MKRSFAEEYDSENGGWWSRLKNRFLSDEEEYDEPEIPLSPKKKGVLLRLHAPKMAEIFVRMNIKTLAEAQGVADKLKERRSVVLNLEVTDEDVAKRVVDFISGVTYALDGYYHKIGDKVFLFTPANTMINVAEESETRSFDSGNFLEEE